MLPLGSMLFGSALLVGGSLWLWYMTSQPHQWSVFVDREHAFCIRWGTPTWLLEPIEVVEKGPVMKAFAVLMILDGAVLITYPVLAAIVLPAPHG